MEVRILGCGPSYGVPSLSRGYGQCNPDNPKNFRLRSSILVRENETTILVDSGPEVRLQLLQAGSPRLDAVLYTHEHYDHMGGADDLRSVLTEGDYRLPVFLPETAVEHFRNILDYLFRGDTKGQTPFQVNIIRPYEPFEINGIRIIPIPQRHGDGFSMGYRIGDCAYSTDIVSMEEEGFEALAGIKVWILGVVTTVPNPKHINLDTARRWINRIKPEMAYLTHMGSRMDYEALIQTLPQNIRPAYDNMTITI